MKRCTKISVIEIWLWGCDNVTNNGFNEILKGLKCLKNVVALILYLCKYFSLGFIVILDNTKIDKSSGIELVEFIKHQKRIRKYRVLGAGLDIKK